MNKNFLQSIDVTESIYGNRNLIVSYQKGSADASFILHHLVADFVKRYGNEGEILLVLCNENVNHWTSISSKLGWNLGAHAAKGALTVVDLTQGVYKALTRNSSGNTITWENGNEDIGVDLDGLFNYCKCIMSSAASKNLKKEDLGFKKNDGLLPSSKKFLVVVDDLTTIQFCSSKSLDPASRFSSISGEKGALNFIRNLLNLSESLNSEYFWDASILTNVNSAGGLCSATIARTLSTVLFEISPLQTGYSQLFSGYITVKRKSMDTNDKDTLVKCYQYKLDERQVKFSPLTKYNF